MVETSLRKLYWKDWPAKTWALIPGADNIKIIHHRIRLRDKRIPALRMAFLSDLHLGPTTPKALLEKAFLEIHKSRAEILLLGGDYVFLDTHPTRFETLTNLLRSLSIPTKIAVLGNHDLWACEPQTIQALQTAGVEVLINQATRLPKPWHTIAVIGLDDPWSGEPNAEPAFRDTDCADYKIVLCHSPEGLAYLDNQHYDFYLCGHTHGGQLATPWWAPILPPGKLCRRYWAGIQTFDEKKIFVSRGIGGAEIPMRLFAPPDILILDWFVK